MPRTASQQVALDLSRTIDAMVTQQCGIMGLDPTKISVAARARLEQQLLAIVAVGLQPLSEAIVASMEMEGWVHLSTASTADLLSFGLVRLQTPDDRRDQLDGTPKGNPE